MSEIVMDSAGAPTAVERERYTWKTFALLFPEVQEQSLRHLRDDLMEEMEGMEDGDVVGDISFGLSGIEVLLSLFDRVGPAVCSELLVKTTEKRLREAAAHGVAGSDHIEHALTHETLLSTALDLQALCDKRLEELGIRAEEMYWKSKGADTSLTDAASEAVGSSLSPNVLAGSTFEDFKDNSEEDIDAVMIGIDNHSPSKYNYPLPGKWRSEHFHHESREVKDARKKSDWIGMNMAQHHHHIKEHLGTTNGLPIARWAGSLRQNAQYAERVAGSRPMRFSQSLGEDGRALNAAKADAVRHAKASSSTTFAGTFRENLAASFPAAQPGADDEDGTRGILKKSNARRERVTAYMKKMDEYKDARKFSYPVPGQTRSKHFKGGKDALRAKQRPYVGMDMNAMRMHIKVGTAGGKNASHWIGSLRSKAKGAPGSTIELPSELETTPRNQAAGDAGEGQREPQRHTVNLRANSKYIGDKTDAMMDGVPDSMRRYKACVSAEALYSPGKAYLRLAEQLATPLVNEHAAKFCMRENLQSKKATRLHIKAQDKEVHKKEVARRNRRREYGEKAAARFKEEKAKRLAAIKAKREVATKLPSPPRTPNMQHSHID